MHHLTAGLVNLGVRLLPPTIHPMVVHFPIALLYVTLLCEGLAYTGFNGDRFFDRASLWGLTLSLLAIVAAGASGIISEHAASFTPQTRAILSAHQHDAILTGVFALAAWCVRFVTVYPATRDRRWSALGTGRGRTTMISTLLVLGAVIMVSVTGSLGGSMVYGHGVGTAATRTHATVPAAGG